MALLNLSISTNKTAETLARDYQRPVSSKYADVQAIAQLLEMILSGNAPGNPPSVSVGVFEEGDFATGSFGLVSVVATDACSINSVTFTAVASGAGANQFDVGADDDETAVNLAAAINASASALVKGCIVAEASDNVVLLTASEPGLIGNQTAIATADSTIIVSAARLTGGDDDSGELVYTF